MSQTLVDHASHNTWDQVVVAIQNGEDVNQKIKDQTAVMYAAKAGNEYILKTLLNAGADPNILCNGDAPLLYAILKRQVAAAIVLIDGGANLQLIGYRGATPLHWAAAYCPSIIPTLLSKGADQNALCSNGWTALDVARREKNQQAIQLLENVTTSPYNQSNVFQKIKLYLFSSDCVVVDHVKYERYHENRRAEMGWLSTVNDEFIP